jgi:hypothetical protein
LELLVLSLADRDEMDDGVAALERGAYGLGLRDVAFDDLAAPRLEALSGLAPVADERTNRSLVGAQTVDDVPSDETGRARDEDHVVDSPPKFCQ